MWSSLLDVGDQILEKSKNVVKTASKVSQGTFLQFLTYSPFQFSLSPVVRFSGAPEAPDRNKAWAMKVL